MSPMIPCQLLVAWFALKGGSQTGGCPARSGRTVQQSSAALCLALLVSCFSTLIASPARAQGEGVQPATVRVLCSKGFELRSAKLAQVSVELAAPSLVQGSGFVAGKKGVIVTARHVVAGAKFVAVQVPGVAYPLPAKVTYSDEKLDVAFLRVLEAVPARADWKNAKRLGAGTRVRAVGYPSGSEGTEARSVEGTVSSSTAENLKLSLTMARGSAGSPVVDEQGRVHAIVTGAAAAAQSGVAAATPIDAFKQELIREVYDKRQGQLEALRDEATLVMTELLTLEFGESTSLMRVATEVDSSSAREVEEKLRSLSKLAAKNPQVAMYMAAFFWNQHVALSAAGRASASPRANAKTLVTTAQGLDPSYQSAFTKLVLSDRSAVELAQQENSSAPGAKNQKTIRFVVQKGVSLWGQPGKLRPAVARGQGSEVRTDGYVLVCQGSCDVTFQPGDFELALARGQAQAIAIERPVKLNGSADLHGSYVDKSRTRTAGLVVFLAGVVGGTALSVVSLIPNCDGGGKSCQRNNLGLLAGAAGVGFGVGLGLPMIFSDDEVGLRLVPRPGGASQPSARRGSGATVEYGGRF
jgi:hypothetical protein